jgi:hypothetical protein
MKKTDTCSISRKELLSTDTCGINRKELLAGLKK